MGWYSSFEAKSILGAISGKPKASIEIGVRYTSTFCRRCNVLRRQNRNWIRSRQFYGDRISALNSLMNIQSGLYGQRAPDLLQSRTERPTNWLLSEFIDWKKVHYKLFIKGKSDHMITSVDARFKVQLGSRIFKNVRYYFR